MFYWSKHFHVGAPAHPPEREGKQQLALGKEPRGCDGSQWFSSIPTATPDLLPMDTIPELSSTQPAQQPGHCWWLCPGQNMGLYVSTGVTRHKSIPKSNNYQNYQLFILVSIEFMVQERAKSRSSHLTTQASLHPKSVQGSIRAEAGTAACAGLTPHTYSTGGERDSDPTAPPSALLWHFSSSPRIIQPGVHLNPTFPYWSPFYFPYKLCKPRDPHRHNKAYLKHTSETCTNTNNLPWNTSK